MMWFRWGRHYYYHHNNYYCYYLLHLLLLYRICPVISAICHSPASSCGGTGLNRVFKTSLSPATFSSFFWGTQSHFQVRWHLGSTSRSPPRGSSSNGRYALWDFWAVQDERWPMWKKYANKISFLFSVLICFGFDFLHLIFKKNN